MSFVGPSLVQRVYPLLLPTIVLLSTACGTTNVGDSAPAARIEVLPQAANVVVGEAVRFSAVARDAKGTVLTGRSISWYSSAAVVASIANNGLATALGPGTTTVSAVAEGKTGTATLTVREVPVADVAVSPTTASLEVGRALQLTATVRDASGNVLRGRQVIWSSSAASLASVTADGVVTAIAPGPVMISATVEANVGTATVTVLPVPVASIVVSPPNAVLSVGATLQFTATLRDANGDALSARQVTWTTSAPAVATAAVNGVVTAVGPGTAVIAATAEGKTATAALSVSARVSISETDSLLTPGTQFLIRGKGLSSVTVSIGGAPATIISGSNELLAVTVPMAPFTPCLGPGRTLAVVVTNIAGDSSSLTRRAVERTYQLSLTTGSYDELTSFVTRGCRIAVSTPGQYVAVMYSPLTPNAMPAQPADSMSVTFRVDAAFAPAAQIVSGREAWISPHRRQANIVAALSQASTDVVLPAFLPDNVAALCALPALGGAVKVSMSRNSAGEITWFGSAAVLEDWRLYRLGQTAAIFFDTTTWRLASQDQRYVSAIDEMTAFIDTAASAFIAANTRGMPDKDGNSRLIVYVTGFAADGFASYASATSSLREDCGTARAGEAIILNVTSPRGPYVYHPAIVHEMAHIADLGWGTSLRTTWAVEGFATLASAVFPLRNNPDPLALNLRRNATYPNGAGVYCLNSYSKAFAGAPFGVEWSYQIGCDLVAYLFQRFQSAFGGRFRDAHTAWVNSNDLLTIEDAGRNFLKQDVELPLTMGEWLMSLYADDFVATSKELQQTTWNLREVWHYEFAGAGPYTLPDVRLAAVPASTSFILGAPDARFVEFSVSQNALLQLSISDGTRKGRFRLAVLRAH